MNFFKKYFHRNNTAVSIILAILIQAGALVLLESFYYDVTYINFPKYLFNLLFWVVICALFCFVFGSLRWGTFATVILSATVGTVEYAVMCFRDSPILPWDLLSLNTGLSVVGNYKLQIEKKQIILFACYAFLLILSLLITLKIKRKKLLIRCGGILLCIAMLIGYAGIAQNEDFQQSVDYYSYLFTPKALYKRNGFAFSFISLLKFLQPSEPSSYDIAAIEALFNEYSDNAVKKDPSEMPNIIVIMDEAFSDIGVLGDFDASEDYMPYFRKISEESVHGYVYSSVVGGNTANSEFEFLTGDSMAFLPSGSIPYQQYITSDRENYVSCLNDLGYYTCSMHPYYATGWYRSSVYKFLGFRDQFFKEAFGKADLREYVSDKECFKTLIRKYKAHKGEEPFFTFCVTMQNHGGYSTSTDFDNFNQIIQADVDSHQSAVSSYLSLIKYSDDALEYLINYFKKVDEPTVICFFGDHLPTTFITDPIMYQNGRDPAAEMTASEYSDLYKVPFIIWANYDIEPRYVETSMNYLNILVSQVAGIPLSPYQKFRMDLSEKFPVITAGFVKTADGEYKYVYEVEKDPDLIEYECVQYNHLFDKDNHLEAFYTLK